MVVCVFIMTGTPEGSTESGFMEKPELNLPPLVYKTKVYPLHHGGFSLLFCGFPGYKPVSPSWFKICVGFMSGTPKGSPKVVLWRSR